MQDTLFVSKIVHSTSVDGVGLRNSLYLSGCHLRCAGCHNKDMWDINSGVEMGMSAVSDLLNIDDFNISILGGEPLLQYSSILNLCRYIKTQYPQKTIWMWSGHTFEQIQEKFSEILQYIDVLVDGPYIQENAISNLPWRGSTNQRIIEIKSID